ncbi:hypothetical protein STAQ_44700 [Allostella sp. ATCC 35155]|nr:hypothetical protein STAQ_44700 [Stella sp. ATCC 35155]
MRKIRDTPPAGTGGAISETARQRERSMLIAGVSDIAMWLSYIVAAVWANSLTTLAETARGTLVLALEWTLFVLLRRIHRSKTHNYDYGAGQLEQFANLGIGLAMGVAGLWIGGSAAYRWWNPPEQAAFGLAFAAAVGLANMLQNGLAFWALWRAGRDGTSVIMMGQIRARMAKLISSALVLCALTVNAVFGDGPVGLAADILGSLFVALVMLELAVSMWRRSLPSLLDRTLEEGQQERINRSLITHFDEYDELVSVRSRVSGNVPMVEIVLGMAPDRTMADVQASVDRIVDSIRELIPGAEVAVIPVAARPPVAD